MTRPIPHDTRQWLGLCRVAMAATSDALVADALLLEASKLVTVHPPLSDRMGRALCHAFRWDCVAFGDAPASVRAGLGPALRHRAGMIRALLCPDPAPVAALAAVPVPEASNEDDSPRREPRRDIFG